MDAQPDEGRTLPKESKTCGHAARKPKHPGRGRVVVPATRKRAEQQRTIETRNRILDAAEAEFAQVGFDGASIRNIASRAGVLHTLATYHFDSKEGLWHATVSRLLAHYEEVHTRLLQEAGPLNDVEKLRMMQVHFIRFCARYPALHRIMSHVASAPSEQLDWLVGTKLRALLEQRSELVRKVQAQGRYVAGDPLHLEYIFIGAVTRVFMLDSEVEQIMGVQPTDPGFVDRHIDLILSLFFKDQGEGAEPSPARI